MTETTKDKVPPRTGRGKVTHRGPTGVEGHVLRAHGFAPWTGPGAVASTWESAGSRGWTVRLWKWEDGSVDLTARLRDDDSGAAASVEARNIVALFALMERFGDQVWPSTEPA